MLVDVVCTCTQNNPLTCGEGDLTASMQATVRPLPSRKPAPTLSLSLSARARPRYANKDSITQ